MVTYDYDKQVWIIDGRYADCGHSRFTACKCYGRAHTGELAETPAVSGNLVNHHAIKNLLARAADRE